VESESRAQGNSSGHPRPSRPTNFRARWRQDEPTSTKAVDGIASAQRQPHQSRNSIFIGSGRARTGAKALTCPLVLASCHLRCLGSPDRVSALSSRATRVRIRPVIQNEQLEGLASHPGFPSRFRCRHSLLGHPVPAGELGPPHGRLTGPRSGPRRGYRVPHACATTGVGALFTPRTAVLIPAETPAQPAPAASQRPVLSSPPPTTHRRGSLTRHQQGFRRFTRPVFPAPGAPGQDEKRLGLTLELRTPPTKSRRRTSRRGQAIEHGPGTTRPTSHPVDLQSCVHSLRATSRRTASRSTTRRPTSARCHRHRGRTLLSLSGSGSEVGRPRRAPAAGLR